ncbi:hypothetical protein FRC01_007235, partial [Tulasnella sp. 417]
MGVIVGVPLFILLAFSSAMFMVPFVRSFVGRYLGAENGPEAETTNVPPPPPSLSIPPLEGKLQLVARKVSGGFGEVYMGFWICPDKEHVKVALKCIRKCKLSPTSNQSTGEERYET